MRLIDADAITEDERQEHGFFYNSDLQELLDEQPTIDISNTSNTLGALDCVDRAEVIKAVKFYETFCDPYPRVVEALEDLPSVKPRRGKWIDTNPDEYLDPRMTCDQCGNTETLHKANFCPNCGCDMREGD